MLLFLGLLFTSCEQDPNADIREVELELDFIRTDSLLYACAKNFHAQPDLDYHTAYHRHLQSARDFLLLWVDDRAMQMQLSDELKDSIIAEMLGPVLADASVFKLLDTIRQVIPYDTPIEERITYPLKRFKKYFPSLEIPAIRTHADGYVPYGDIRSVDQIIYAPGYMSLGLHYFLGADFPYYPTNVAHFIRKRFDLRYLEVALTHQLVSVNVPALPYSFETRLVDQLIQEGIKQYIIHQLLPNTADSLIHFYTSKQMDWVNYFEANIYNEIIKDIYSVDIKVFNRYLGDKPSSTHLSLESAPRLGQYAGYKIVEAYMKRHQEVSLDELRERTDYEVIFREAKYKP